MSLVLLPVPARLAIPPIRIPFHPHRFLPVRSHGLEIKVEQKFDVTPKAEIRLNGHKVTRSVVTNDWGLMLQWVVKRDGKVIATAHARANDSYELPGGAPGEYSVVLQSWKYVNYAKDAAGEFTASKFIDISNTVTFTII